MSDSDLFFHLERFADVAADQHQIADLVLLGRGEPHPAHADVNNDRLAAF